MSHQIDRRMTIGPKLPPEALANAHGWELDLLSMCLCLKCGKYLHPAVWEGPCAWDRPGQAKDYRREVLAELALEGLRRA